MKRSIILPFLLFTILGFSQNARLWSDKPEAEMRRPQDRQIFPAVYRTVGVDIEALRTFLDTAPDELEVPPPFSDVIFEVPAPDGTFEAFHIVEYSMMQPDLTAEYPEIKTYRGISVDDALRTIRFDWTAKGFSAVISGAGEQYLIDPFAKRNQEDYISYYRKDYPGTGEFFVCHYEQEKPLELPDGEAQRVTGDCTFRSYRLAVAARGEYSNFHDAFSPDDSDTVMAAVVISVNRINEVYERDVAVRFILIANTDDVFYYDGNTDPFSGGTCSQLSQNQTNMDNVIGSANYDVGHLFGGSGGGGCASLNVPCTGSKARGHTSLNSPVGDVFWIDYLSHEIGHQFGGNHTQNNSCNRHLPTAMEPGSATTIMGYAGVCVPNVQNNSDDYFHGISLQEMNNFTANGSGNNCDVPVTPWANLPPVVMPGSDYTIPRSTPFMLTAAASDGDEDPLTYCWEQWDNEVGSMPPSPTNSQGPMFRSFDPAASPIRYFPRLEDLVDNISPTWEVLPSVARNMEFRVTVRDFHNGLAGCTDEDNVLITVSGSSGPFAITEPNTGAVEWSGGATESVEWNVANTNTPPVSCDMVDILLSYDGGFTYPDTLAAGVPNDGAHNIIAPTVATTIARVMVKCSDNVFFDISNQDFEIIEGEPDYTLEIPDSAQTICANDTVYFQIDVLSLFGYSDSVTLTLTGAPQSIEHEFSINPVLPGNTTMLSIFNLDALPITTYLMDVEGISTTGAKQTGLSLELIDVPGPVGLLSPDDNALEVLLTPQLSWVDDPVVDFYEVQVSTDIQFSTIIAAGAVIAPEFVILDELAPMTSYFWRVRSIAGCSGQWSEIREFQTLPCANLISTDVPIVIPTGAPPISGRSRLDVPDFGTIVDVNVLNINGTHSDNSELVFTITSTDGATAILFSEICPGSTEFNLGFDDQGVAGAIPCPPNSGTLYQPETSLSALNNGQPGLWRLTFDDLNPESNGGLLEGWGLRVCLTDFTCEKVVLNTNDNGPGSLRATLACAENGDTITFDPIVFGQTINLISPLEVVKNLYVSSSIGDTVTIDGSQLSHVFGVPAGATVGLEGLTLIAGLGPEGAAVANAGNLLLRDITIIADPVSDPVFNSGSLTLEGACRVID